MRPKPAFTVTRLWSTDGGMNDVVMPTARICGTCVVLCAPSSAHVRPITEARELTTTTCDRCGAEMRLAKKEDFT